MDVSRIEKKLREATYFLNKMSEREQMAFGEHEQYDFCLSAFLNATRVVDYRLRHEQQKLYKSWRSQWDGRLSAADASLIKFMIEDRIAEVHKTGSRRRASAHSG